MVLSKLKDDIELAKNGDYSLFLAEVPLYFESNFNLKNDFVVLVYCSKRNQLLRIENKGEKYKYFEEIQDPLDSKVSKSEYVVYSEVRDDLILEQSKVIFNF